MKLKYFISIVLFLGCLWSIEAQTTIQNSSIAVYDTTNTSTPFDFQPKFRYDTTTNTLRVFEDGSWIPVWKKTNYPALSDTSNILVPYTGMQVYFEDVDAYYYYDGSNWELNASGGTVSASSVVVTTSGNLASVNAQSALEEHQTDLDNLYTLQGTSYGATNLGTFTGATITDNQTIKGALQDLETAVESVSGSGVSDGDKGDVVVSSSGTVWTIDTSAIDLTKLNSIVTPGTYTNASITVGEDGRIYSAADGDVGALTARNFEDFFKNTTSYYFKRPDSANLDVIELLDDDTGILYEFEQTNLAIGEDWMPVKAVYFADSIRYDINYELQDSLVGSFSGTTLKYTTQQGARVYKTFTGISIVGEFYSDFRGSAWRCWIDGLTDTTTVDTYSASAVYFEQQLFSGLADGTYTLVMEHDTTYKNPLNTSGINRAWLVTNTVNNPPTLPFRIVDYEADSIYTNYLTDIQPTTTESFFAYSVKQSGSLVSAEWIPEHSNNSSNNYINDSLIIKVAGVEYQDSTITDFTAASNLVVLQNIRGYNNSEPDSTLVDIYASVEFKNGGAIYSHGLKFLRATTLTGYSMMVPFSLDYIDSLVVSNGQKIGAYSVLSTENENINGAAFQYVAKPTSATMPYTFVNITSPSSIRFGQTGQSSPYVFFQRRTAAQNINKLYISAYDAHTSSVGESHFASIHVRYNYLSSLLQLGY